MKHILLIAGALYLAVAAPVRASEPPPPLGEPANQLAIDMTAVPAGMGAIFVPSPSLPELEPVLHVYAGEQRVATSALGRRVILPPGHYTVVAGQGPMEWRARTSIEVRPDETVLVPPFFAAVRVGAIDLRDKAVATSYLLVSAEGGRIYGPEKTAEGSELRATRTWLVAPGRYFIVLGRSAERRSDRIAIDLQPGARLDYRLVVDDDRLVRTEFADRVLEIEDQLWRVDWILGGSLALDRSKNELGGFSGDALRLGALTRLEVGLDHGDHLALLRLALDESWVGLEHAFGRGLPFQKLTDTFQARILYNYRLGEILGPYVLARVRTSFFPTKLYTERDTSVTVSRKDGTEETFDAEAGSEIRLLPGLAPLIAQESAGLGVTVFNTEAFGLTTRFGVALRQQDYGGAGRFVIGHGSDTLDLIELGNAERVGGEVSIALRLRISDVFTVQSDIDAFVGFDELTGDIATRPVFYWDSAASLSISSWASLVYQVIVHRDDRQIEELQIRQSLNLRFQYSLF